MADRWREKNQPDRGQDEVATTILLSRIRENDQRALGDLVERLQPKIARWIRKERRGGAIRRKYETMDLSQDVALDLIRYLPTVVVSDSRTLDRILYRMIQNTLRDTYDHLMALRRRLTRERPLPTDTVLNLDPPNQRVETPSELAERNEQDAWIRLALPLLDPADEELILRHRIYGESYVALGERFELTADATRMRCNRALTRLVKLVGLLRRGQVERALEESVRGESGGGS